MHVESATLALEAWHDFYLLIGTAAAALVALLFVAVSVGVGYLTHERAAATRIFLSPIVIHFSAVLVVSVITLTPAQHPLFIESALTLTGLIGVIVSSVILIRVSRLHYDDMVFFDNLGYGAIPAVAYASIVAATILASRGWPWSLHLLAVSVMMLLLVNIRNAWDAMLSLVRRQSESHNRE